MPIRLALLGAGIFMKEAHIPAILSLPDHFQVVAIYSRTLESAQQAAQLLPYPVQVTDDLPALLAQPDLEAVAIALPIHAQAQVVEQALRSGKHVLSEKPIAPTRQQAEYLLQLVEPNVSQVWMVAENWRYAPAIQRAAQIIQAGDLGHLALFHWAVCAGMTPQRPYYHTPWRRDGSHPGGFLLDGGIHLLAGLRTVLGEVSQLYAIGRLVRPDLPPVDTVSLSLSLQSGLTGTLSLTYAYGLPAPTFLTVVGEYGVLEVNRDALQLTLGGQERERMTGQGNGILAEFQAFAQAIHQSHPSLPMLQEALRDLILFEALLSSLEQGQAISIPTS
jgi:predicted dehydrogenase